MTPLTQPGAQEALAEACAVSMNALSYVNHDENCKRYQNRCDTIPALQ